MRTQGMTMPSYRSLRAAVALLLLSAPGAAAAGTEEAQPARPEVTGEPVLLGEATGDPESDTVALDVRRTPAGAAGARAGDAVRVGQGLRPDGTELGVTEVPRPWLIKQ